MTHILRIDEMFSNDIENNKLYETLIDHITQYGIGDEDAENMAQDIVMIATDFAKKNPRYSGNISSLVHEWLMENWSNLFGTEEEYDNFCQDVAICLADTIL